MTTSSDEGRFQRVGSHLKMRGKVLGINVFLEEVVTRRELPRLKLWETVGNVNLLVIGHYQMGFEVKPHDGNTTLRVFIDYANASQEGLAWAVVRSYIR